MTDRLVIAAQTEELFVEIVEMFDPIVQLGLVRLRTCEQVVTVYGPHDVLDEIRAAMLAAGGAECGLAGEA